MSKKKKQLTPIEQALIDVTNEADVLITQYNDKHQELRDLWARILMLSGKQQALIELQEAMKVVDEVKD